mgnify:CR=1 FL=1|tara:strand:+ start:93 stop:344 length:252 start_codon:yes stop_codon:yes gene_type:complete
MQIDDLKETLPMINNKVDYNFQTILHLSILIEFLFKKLKEHDPDIDLESGLEEFQELKIQELQQATDEAVKDLESEDLIDIKL